MNSPSATYRLRRHRTPWHRTGTQPILAAGNAASDIAILQAAHFPLVVHRDDSVRECAYDGDQILTAASCNRWTMLNMRDDFSSLWA